jgi:hypothetical protein
MRTNLIKAKELPKVAESSGLFPEMVSTNVWI